MSGSARRKRRMQALWREQNGICYWCPVQMIHWNDRKNDPAKQTPEMQKMWATLDHLRPRHDPTRCVPPVNGEQRWVLACWDCNNKRDRKAVMAIPIEQRWLASRSYPQDVIPPPFVIRAKRNGKQGRSRNEESGQELPPPDGAGRIESPHAIRPVELPIGPAGDGTELAGRME